MEEKVIIVKNLSKSYKLGQLNSGSFAREIGKLINNVFRKKKEKKTKKKYNETITALNSVSLDVYKGEVLGIIGKNGSGKSTLLKLLSRISVPNEGKIIITGRLGVLLEVGTAMHPDLTGRENIYLNGGVLGMTKIEIDEKIDKIIDFFSYPEYINTPIKHYSSGMKIRLGFSVAAFLETDILIVDEVLAVGDLEFQRKALGKMGDIIKEKEKTILFVSHNLSLIKSICSRTIVLNKGNIIYNGDTNEAIQCYIKKNTSNSYNKIKAIKDREGSGQLRVSKVDLLNENNEPLQFVETGAFVKIKIEFDIHKKIDFNRLVIFIFIYDEFKQLLTQFVSDEMGFVFKPKKEDDKQRIIFLEIPEFNLRSSLYHADITINDGAIRGSNCVDKIERALDIKVISKDYWESGKVIRKGSFALLNGKFI